MSQAWRSSIVASRNESRGGFCFASFYHILCTLSFSAQWRGSDHTPPVTPRLSFSESFLFCFIAHVGCCRGGAWVSERRITPDDDWRGGCSMRPGLSRPSGDRGARRTTPEAAQWRPKVSFEAAPGTNLHTQRSSMPPGLKTSKNSSHYFR